MLSVAFLGEVVGAYGKQHKILHESNKYFPAEKELQRRSLWWMNLWYGVNQYRVLWLTHSFCMFVRGCTRLAFGAFLIARFAVGQELLWFSIG